MSKTIICLGVGSDVIRARANLSRPEINVEVDYGVGHWCGTQYQANSRDSLRDVATQLASVAFEISEDEIKSNCQFEFEVE